MLGQAIIDIKLDGKFANGFFIVAITKEKVRQNTSTFLSIFTYLGWVDRLVVLNRKLD